MKKSLFVAAFAALAVVACKKTEVVDTTNDMDSMDAMVVDTMNSPMMEDSTTMKLGDSSTVVVEADNVVVEAPAVK